MCCRNFKRVCKLNHEGRKTLYLDQLVVWEWSVFVLTTKDLQLIKETNDGPWLRSMIVSLDEYQVCDLTVLSKGMMPNDSKRVYIATKTWIFTSIESLACRKDVFDEVQRVDYDKILIYRSDALVFADSSSKCVLDTIWEFCKVQKVARKVCKHQWLKWV